MDPCKLGKFKMGSKCTILLKCIIERMHGAHHLFRCFVSMTWRPSSYLLVQIKSFSPVRMSKYSVGRAAPARMIIGCGPWQSGTRPLLGCSLLAGTGPGRPSSNLSVSFRVPLRWHWLSCVSNRESYVSRNGVSRPAFLLHLHTSARRLMAIKWFEVSR